jgi:hypothetical protein
MADLGGCAVAHGQQGGASPDRSAIGFANETAAAPMAAAVPFRGKISERAHQQTVEQRSRKSRENCREKQKQRKPFIGIASSRPFAGIKRTENDKVPLPPSAPSRLSGALLFHSTGVGF